MSKKQDETINERDELIPFEIIKENWSTYELEDGTIIRFKFVLINIIKTPIQSEKGNLLLFNARNVIGVFSPEERGDKDRNYTVEELEKYISKLNVMFRQIVDSGLNEYKTDKHTIIITPRVTKIDKTSKFDKQGMPAYIVRSETQFLVVEEKIEK